MRSTPNPTRGRYDLALSFGNERQVDTDWRRSGWEAGKFSSGAPLGSGDGPHDWVVIHLDSGTKAVYSDHRRFGFMDCFPTSQQEKQASLGFGSGAYSRPISSTGSRRRTEG